MKHFLILPITGLLLLSGCVSPSQRTQRHQATSVVQFLYPDQSPLITPSTPTLRLPLRVGIAFVPVGKSKHGNNAHPLDETRQQQLMQAVSAEFKNLPFVQGIEHIPGSYLRPEGSFTNLDQLKSMFGVDVIVLLSTDQTQNTGSNRWSFAYWSIVGLYFIEAERNDTHTMLDATVYDIASRKLLFRAPGINTVKHHSAPVYTNEELRRDPDARYTAAAAALTQNLKTELEAFKVRIKEAPEEIKIERRPGYTGGGSLDALCALGLVGVLTYFGASARRSS